MKRDVRVRKVETVPAEAAGYHDELGEELKQAFPALVEDGGGAVHGSVAEASVSERNCVKFTDSYRITCG